MRPATISDSRPLSAPCVTCGIPFDAKPFDESGTARIPARGRDQVLARFELPPQYCGVLQLFSQFWEENVRDPTRIVTEGLQWIILVNRRPLHPYVALERVVNPWGIGSFPIAIRLDENATVEFAVRNRAMNVDPDPERRPLVGGRIVGRYWYNACYGDVLRSG